MAETSCDVFLSHSSSDADAAAWLTDYLEECGIKVWIAPRDVRPGRDYAEQIQAAIEASSAIIVLVSADANKSSFVRAETEMGFSQDKRIFPVRTAPVEPGPGLALFLQIKHWTNAYGLQRERALSQLVAEIKGDGEEPAGQRFAAAAGHGAADPEKLKRFIGPAAAYYLNAWAAMQRRRTLLSWNWAAFFAGLAAPGAWPAYRRMWALAWFLVPLDLLLTHSLHQLGGSRLPLVVLFLPSAIAGLLLGLFANAIYRANVLASVAVNSEDPGDAGAIRQRQVSRTGLILLLIVHGAIAALYLVPLRAPWS
ncbi:MAG: toll/interleukin-1 receptor domain-containing protein [Allosphingosinicella sp.]|uniref:toll/interleukin-1 receptor domain-containing protein n=1 Tax=Allosphingosinicella sp. TaxID=2823234 RepID=UPI00392AFAE5